ncbi:MAG: hypothetical protein ACE5HD_11065 [Acidobacteriota bacterium]
MVSQTDTQSAAGPPEPTAEEVIDVLEARLGEEGLQRLVADCLRAADRRQAVELIHASLGMVRLSAAADRGRMGRLLVEGLRRRRAAVLDVVQSIARQPFDRKASPEQRKELDEAVDGLNQARGDQAEKGAARRRETAGRVVAAIRAVLEFGEARRLVLVNAFPDTLDPMLEALGDEPGA